MGRHTPLARKPSAQFQVLRTQLPDEQANASGAQAFGANQGLCMQVPDGTLAPSAINPAAQV